MAPIDLDAFEREWVFSSRVAPILRDLVAELRAVREVVEEARSLAENLLVGWEDHVPRDVTAGHARLVELLGGGS